MPTNQNIIEIIQQMIRSGESEEKILQNLADLGVNSDQAQKLLFISQSDIQDALQTEINESVSKQLEKERQKLYEQLRKQLAVDEEEAEKKIEAKILAAQAEYQQKMDMRMSANEAKVSQNVDKAIEISRLAREKSTVSEQRVKTIEEEHTTFEDPTFKPRGNKKLSQFLFLIGVGIAAAAIYYVTQHQKETLGGENIPIVIGLAGLAVIVMYVSSLV